MTSSFRLPKNRTGEIDESMRLFVPKILLFLASVAGSQLLLAAAQPGGSVNKGEDGVAVKGYDVVAYFDQKKPMKGDPKYSYQ